MEVLRKAPMLAVLGALVTSMALSDAAPGALLLSPLFAVGLSLCTFQRRIRNQVPALLVVFVLTLLCGLRIYAALTTPLTPPSSLRTTGTVSLVRQWGRNFVAVLDTQQGGFLIRMHFAEVLEGDRLNVEGVTRPLKSAAGSGGFDESRFWRAQGVTAWLSPSSMEPLPAGWSLPRMRGRIARALAIHMPPLTGAYLRAAWLGDRDSSLNEAHRAWGTSHLLAVSGFHVGIVALFASFLLRGCRRRGVALSAILWGYVLLTGAAPSALRAALMFQAALAALALGRPASPVNSVCLAAVLLLLHSPFLFWDIGWRLSVLAAMTITAFFGKSDAKSSKERPQWRKWLLLSPLIALVTFPQVAWTFQRFPLAGLLLNLAAPAFFSVGFVVASVSAILYFIGMPFARWLPAATEGTFVLWSAAANGAARLIPFTLNWGPFTAWLGAGALFFLLCRFMGLSAPRTAVLTTAGALASFLIFL